MAYIQIKRKNLPIDIFRDYIVLANDKPVGKLSVDKDIEFEVADKTEIKLKIDWCYSNSIVINSDESKVILEGSSNIFNWRILVYFLYLSIFRKSYLKLTRLN